MKKSETKSEKTVKKPVSENWFSRMIAKVFVRIILILLLVLAAGTGSVFAYKKLSQVKVENRKALVSDQIEEISELSVLKYGYSDIVTIKKTRIAGLAKAFSIVRYSAVIRIGIDNFEDMKINVSPYSRKIGVVLPDCKILSNDISELQVFDESRSIFIPISTQEIFDLINQSRNETAQNLSESALLKDARIRVKTLVESVLKNSGYDKIEVSFDLEAEK